MAPVCARFVQNAWKKDMCSNCFRSRPEHAAPEKRRPPGAGGAAQPPRSIILRGGRKPPTKRTVSFSPEPAQVIGHGGEEWSDDEGVPEDISSSASSSEDDSSPCPDEDKELDKITKINTDHNTNLLIINGTKDNKDKRRTFAQLMLGKTQTDAEGNKQTLLVSVTPFGHGDNARTRSHIPIAKNRDALVDKKTNVVLTAYTKNNKDVDKQQPIEETIVEKNNNINIQENEVSKMNGFRNENEIDSSVEPDQSLVSSKQIIKEPIVRVEEKFKEESVQLLENTKEEVKSEVVEEIIDAIQGYSEVIIVERNEEIQVATSTVNCELVKSRTELTIQLAPVTDQIILKESEESDESLTTVPKESREQAGEPDGRADPDVIAEPPALPLTPPPPLLNPRISFLHGSPKSTPPDKPKVPSKPDKVLQLFKKVAELPPFPSIAHEFNKTPNKRRAPNPPPSPVVPDVPPMVRSASLPEAVIFDLPPEPAPRRTLSVSQENLLVELEKLEEKTKKDSKSKSKFSLKKLLRVGGGGGGGHNKSEAKKDKDQEPKDKTPQAKPRLVIVHPLELNGSGVEVVRQEDIRVEGIAIAPAPPPRNISLERPQESRPVPPPPKSDELLRKQQQTVQPPSLTTRTCAENVYANLGEVRSGLAPSKPQRTASMREREQLLEQRRRLQQEHVYERLGPRRAGEEPHRPKSSSMTSYNGSETDSGDGDVGDCPDWGGCSRLRCRKGRSVLHRNLEDNYGAVVVANREALEQVLDNLHQTPNVQPALRGLQNASVLRWTDFAIVDDASGVVVGKRAFYHGLWGPHHVTLALSTDRGSMHKPALGSLTLCPVIEFDDLVPATLIPLCPTQDSNMIQASVSVLPWLHIDTVHEFGVTMKTRFSQGQIDDVHREVSFVLLQLINGLKTLQAQGTEEVPLSLNNLVLCKDVDRDAHHRLCLLQGSNEDLHPSTEERLGSLCQCALAALDELLPSHRLAPLIRCLLRKESAVSLSQVKSVLEFSLWGPSDVALGVPLRDRELALQRWLDLERATVLHGLVGTRVQLSVLEESHLLFLVRSSAKMMCEAALLLESNGVS